MKINIKICDNCEKLKNIVIQTSELNLCQQCANEFEKIESKNQLIFLFSKEKFCKNCNLTESELNEFGKMGCGECYDTFKDFLEKKVFPYHKSREHIGKIPKNLEKPEEQLKTLKLKYAKALETEKFEELADLKKQINDLTQKI